jgi:hypothetical protein
MARRISEDELRSLRNDIGIDWLINKLGVSWKRRDGYLRFLCPHCSEFHTATNPTTNLARCFRCNVNFNPIELIMVERRLSFLEAVRELRLLRCDDPQKA